MEHLVNPNVAMRCEQPAFYTDPLTGDAASSPYCEACDVCQEPKLTVQWREGVDGYLCDCCFDHKDKN